MYHYGWVHEEKVMGEKFGQLQQLGIVKDTKTPAEEFTYEDLSRFPIYFGSHPRVMKENIAKHSLSVIDKTMIKRKYWWHPLNAVPVRYKRHRGLKRRILASVAAGKPACRQAGSENYE